MKPPREISFRGRGRRGEWYCGDLLQGPKEASIRYRVRTADGQTGTAIAAVDPATVGEYSGVRDARGAPIYEGDILTAGSGECARGPWYAIYDDGEFILSTRPDLDKAIERHDKVQTKMLCGVTVRHYHFTVTGNIHDAGRDGK